MAMKCDSIGGTKENIKVEGDLGDIQIIEEVSDDDDIMCAKQKDLMAVNNLPKPNVGAIVQAGTVPVFGSVSVTNSDNVQFGNNTYFNGPVTIIQSKSGMENTSYMKTDDENSANDQFQPKTKFEVPATGRAILTWHKLTFSALCVVVVGGICGLVLLLRTKNEDSNGSFTYSNREDTAANKTVMEFNYDILPVILTIIILLALSLIKYSYHILTSMASEYNGVLKNENMKNDIRSAVATRDTCMYNRGKVEPPLIPPDNVRIVSRSDWLAQPPEGAMDKLQLPAPWVIITHTATESCYTQSDCVLRVRVMQTFHIESRKWSDIGYNFLVGADGSAYDGRGWDYVGAHTKHYNIYSIAIAFIGTFNNEDPPVQQIEACRKLIKLGVSLGKIAKDYKLFAHRQLMSTLSPGDKVFNIIKEWPHFVGNVTDVHALIPKRKV